MSSRLSFAFAVLLLLLGGVMRFNALTTFPAGLHDEEITNIRITETARNGNIEVFYDLGDEGREGLYQIVLTFVTSAIGDGTLGFRMVSTWAGMLTLAAVYAVARRLSGSWGGLAAMGLMTVNFWPVLLARSITPVTLLPLWVALTLLALSIALPIYRRKRSRGDNTTIAAILGLLLGTGIYIYPVWLLLIVSSLVFVIYMLRTRQQISRRRLSYISFTLLIMIILSVPYIISTIRQPELSGLARLPSEDNLTSIPETLADGLGGLFLSGDSAPMHNLPGRPLFDPVSVVVIVAGLVTALQSWRQPRYAIMLIPMLILSPVFLLSPNAPNFINYTAALPLFALLFGLGISRLQGSTSRWRMRLGGALVVVLVGFNAVWTYTDLFQTWPKETAVQTAYETRLGQLAAHIDRTADDVPTVICGWRPTQSPDARRLTDSQLINLMMNRKRDANVRYVDCAHALVMTDSGNRQQVILTNSTTLEIAHPEVKRWLDQGTLQQAVNLPPDGVLTMDVEESLASHVGQFITNQTVTYAPEASEPPEQEAQMPVSFGGNLTLLGYAIQNKREYTPGEAVTLITYWRTQGMVPPDLVLFSHLLADPGASPPANRDIIYVNPLYLRDRDVFVQVTRIRLPESLPAGEYQLSVGGYQDTSGERLNVLSSGEAYGTRLFLESVTVTAGEG